MNDMTEQERDAATIVAEWRAELDTHDREAQDGDRTWHFTHYIRADPEAFIRAALSELDRLQADNARLRAACEGVPEMMQDMIGYLRSDTGWMHRSYDQYAEEIVTKVATLRAILDGAK